MIKGIIWDCDGCLIDSEIVACRVAAEHYTRSGFPLTTEEYIRDFAGMTVHDIHQVIESKFSSWSGVDYEQIKNDVMKAFETDLQPIDGIHQVMADVKHMPQAVASGSWMERLNLCLNLTDLYSYLAPHIYSSEMVENGKPAPDVFLLAAEKINLNPANALVIEDGHHGVHGAIAAGMTVFGFTGASHGDEALARRLLDAGAELVFDDMRELPNLIKQYNMKKSA